MTLVIDLETWAVLYAHEGKMTRVQVTRRRYGPVSFCASVAERTRNILPRRRFFQSGHGLRIPGEPPRLAIILNPITYHRGILPEGMELSQWRRKMKDQLKTKKQLLEECRELRARITELEASQTEAKRTEEALRESQERLNLALAGADSGLWDWEMETDELYFNDDWLQRIGYTRNEIPKYSVVWRDEMVHHDDWPRLRADIILHFKGLTSEYENEHRIRKKNADWMWIMDRGKVIKRDERGRALRMIGMHLDITQRKHVEKALVDSRAESTRSAHLASIGELASGVAHEINNPINSIINLSQVLVNECNSLSVEHNMAQRILMEGDRIATIVGSLLSFASDKNEEKIHFTLYKVVNEALALTQAQLRNSGIELQKRVSSDLPEIIGHPQRIQQVFLNLISNARYALNQKNPAKGEGRKLLDISAEQITIDDKPYVRTVFLDTGTGVAADIIHRVLEPFFSTKPAGQGTGLGLSVSHGIIRDHNGKLSIESSEGKFTKIIIDLPAGNQNES